MEDQNNNEINNKIEVNGVKQSKKKVKVSTIVIIVLVVLLLFSCVGNIGGSDSSSSSATGSATATEDKGYEEKEDEKESEKELGSEEESDEKEEPDVQLADEESYIPENVSAHFYVGDAVSYKSGTTVTIMDVGIVASNHYGVPVVWMDVELDNQSEKADTWYSQVFSVYIDDYQIETSPVSIEANDDFDPFETSVNPGRKAKFKFTSKLPSDYDSAGKIEIEFPGSTKTVLVKENGVYLYGLKETPVGSPDSEEEHELDASMYGDYASLDGLDYILNLELDGWADAAVILKADYDHQWLLFMEDERNGYLTYMEGDDKVGSIYFSTDGIMFENDDFPEFNGLYW